MYLSEILFQKLCYKVEILLGHLSTKEKEVLLLRLYWKPQFLSFNKILLPYILSFTPIYFNPIIHTLLSSGDTGSSDNLWITAIKLIQVFTTHLKYLRKQLFKMYRYLHISKCSGVFEGCAKRFPACANPYTVHGKIKKHLYIFSTKPLYWNIGIYLKSFLVVIPWNPYM